MKMCWLLSNASSASVEMILYVYPSFTDWFSYGMQAEAILLPRDKSHLIRMCNPFNAMLNCVGQNFVKEFYIYVHLGYWPENAGGIILSGFKIPYKSYRS